MRRLLIDTDVAIDYLRGRHYARQLLEGLWQDGEACLSVVSVYELYAGLRPGEEAATEAFIDACRVLPVDRSVARAAGEWRRRWQAEGITLTTADCLIAGTARVHGLRVATRNVRHYPDPDLRFDPESPVAP